MERCLVFACLDFILYLISWEGSSLGTATKSLKIILLVHFIAIVLLYLYLVLNLKLCKTFLQLSISLSSAEDSAVSSDSIYNDGGVCQHQSLDFTMDIYRTWCPVFNKPHVIFISQLENNFDMFSEERPKHDWPEKFS